MVVSDVLVEGSRELGGLLAWLGHARSGEAKGVMQLNGLERGRGEKEEICLEGRECHGIMAKEMD